MAINVGEILGHLASPLGVVFTGATMAVIGAVVSPLVLKAISSYRDKALAGLADGINKQSPAFKQLIKHLTEDLDALAKEQFPTMTNDAAVGGLIKRIQDGIPNWLLSDDAVSKFLVDTFKGAKKITGAAT